MRKGETIQALRAGVELVGAHIKLRGTPGARYFSEKRNNEILQKYREATGHNVEVGDENYGRLIDLSNTLQNRV